VCEKDACIKRLCNILSRVVRNGCPFFIFKHHYKNPHHLRYIDMKMKITIPTSLKDITLRQYKHFLKVQEDITDEGFLNAKMIEIFCNIRLDEVMLLHLRDSLAITDKITKIFDEKPSLVTMFKLNGTEYGFQPQLDEITLGEYIDLDTFISDWDNMEKAMNVLYRPVLVKLKGKYSIDEYQLGAEANIWICQWMR